MIVVEATPSTHVVDAAQLRLVLSSGEGAGPGGGVSLGETSTTAYRGDRGKTAYDHSQVTTGNPHGTTASDVGADPAGTAAGLVDDLSGVSNQATARTNLGLGTAAVTDTGTGSSNVILGNDARLTDSRTPTSHNHAASEITSGTIDQARLGTGSAGAGAKFLADDQTYKTVSSGIADPGGANDDFLQRKSGAWTYRTPAQVKTDLGVTARLQAGFPTLSGGIGSDNWGLPPGCLATLTAATISVGTGMAWVVPFSVDSDVTITAAAVRATATASGSVTRCAIVRLDNTLQPSSLVHEFTTFDTSSSGVKSQTGLSVALTPGIYATYTKTEVAAPTLVYMSGFINALMPMVATLSAGGGISAVMTASIGAGAYANPPAGGSLFNGTPLSLLFLRWTNP